MFVSLPLFQVVLIHSCDRCVWLVPYDVVWFVFNVILSHSQVFGWPVMLNEFTRLHQARAPDIDSGGTLGQIGQLRTVPTSLTFVC